MNVFGRISREWSLLEGMVLELTKVADEVVVYEHVADQEVSRTHIHFYLENFTQSIEGVKKRVRKICPDISKSDWAFNMKEVNRSCITYMSKGTLEPVFNSGIDCNEYKELWEERPKKQYQPKLQFVTRETASEAKKRKNDLVKEMIIEINERDKVSTTNLPFHTEVNIVDVIIKVLNDNNIIFGRYTVRDYYDTIVSRTRTAEFVQVMNKFCGYST